MLSILLFVRCFSPGFEAVPHTLFSSSQPGSSPSPPRDALLPPASVCWRAPHSVPAVSFPLHDLIQSHSFKGSLCADDSQIVSSHQTFPLLRMSSPTCPWWDAKFFPLKLPFLQSSATHQMAPPLPNAFRSKSWEFPNASSFKTSHSLNQQVFPDPL